MKSTRHGEKSTEKNSENPKINYTLLELDKPLQDVKKFGSAMIITPEFLTDMEFFLFASQYVNVGFSAEHRRDIMQEIMNLPEHPEFVIPTEKRGEAACEVQEG